MCMPLDNGPSLMYTTVEICRMSTPLENRQTPLSTRVEMFRMTTSLDNRHMLIAYEKINVSCLRHYTTQHNRQMPCL